MLALPCVILLARNGYHLRTELWWGAVIGLPSLAVLLLPYVWRLRGRLCAPLQGLGAVGVMVAAARCLPDPRLLAPFLSLVGVLGAALVPGRPGRLLGWAGAVALLLTAILAWTDPNPWYALLVAPVGALHGMSAYRRREGLQLLVTAGLALGAVLGHLLALLHLPAQRPWIPGALGSLLLLALSSLLERHRGLLEQTYCRLRAHLGDEGGQGERG